MAEEGDAGSVRIEEAIEFAFREGLAVRGREARQAALVSLGLHASRTVDPAPFLARDPDLATRAAGALATEKREDLALQVLLWELDGRGSQGESELPRPLRAYRMARAWASGGGDLDNLAWIRDVPRDLALREILARRLLLRAEAGGPHRERLAAACMEAELAELPRVKSFPTLFRACVVARSLPVVDRALEGLGALDPADDKPAGQRLFAQLRASLKLLRLEIEGSTAATLAQAYRSMLAPGAAPSLGVIASHVAAALARGGDLSAALALLERADEAIERSETPLRDAFASLAYVRGWLRASSGGSTAAAPEPDLLRLPSERRPTAGEIAFGAAEAARALRTTGPALHALRLFDPEDLGGVLPERGSAPFVTELTRTASQVASDEGDFPSVKALGEMLRRLRMSPGGDVYLRAFIADAAARIAARTGNDEAWVFAIRLSSGVQDRFERAKLRGRMASEFAAATETAAVPPAFINPAFALPTAPAAAPSDGALRDL
jgi:hypothetical protein